MDALFTSEFVEECERLAELGNPVPPEVGTIRDVAAAVVKAVNSRRHCLVEECRNEATVLVTILETWEAARRAGARRLNTIRKL